ncbi:MAG: hypothetical protein QXS48_00780 [Candidatus Aenigmatarchaeota archaeon]
MLEFFYTVAWYAITSLTTVLSSILFYYSSQLYRNFKRSKNFALLMFFTKPKIPEAFKKLCFFMFLFLVLMVFAIFFLPYSLLLAWIGADIVLLGFISFFKTLAENTKE